MRKTLFIIGMIFYCHMTLMSIEAKNKSRTTPPPGKTYYESLDKILKCGDYAFDEGYFYYPDAGCVYDGKCNPIGNASVFLLPPKSRSMLRLTVDQADLEVKKIMKLSIEQIKKSFVVYIFIIDKKYLINTQEGYYQKFPYKIKCYVSGVNSTEWNLKSIYTIKNIKEEQYYNNKMWQIIRNEVRQ